MAPPTRHRPIPFRPARPGEGYFEDDSVIRRVHRELIVAFSGARALLIQAAHPVMFEGFYSRTTGLDDPHARLARTATVMDTIYFGRRDDADAEQHRHRGDDHRDGRVLEPGEGVVGGVVIHQAFHQHQHRGEVAMVLTNLGHSPGEIDAFDWFELEGTTLDITPGRSAP